MPPDDRPIPGLARCLDAWGGTSPVLALTGAGISAESGVPTFRGQGGMWVPGTEHFVSPDIATFATFSREPERVWAFYLARILRHRDAQPNAGHRAIVSLGRGLGESFLLITQNVDGLHERAGSDPARTFCVHGRLDRVRCVGECGLGIVPLPEGLPAPGPDGRFPEAARELLTCRRCGGWLRPHVLWFDEYYDEEHFRFESSLRAALAAGLLLVVGTSGTTNLPSQIVGIAVERQIPMIVVDPEDGTFQSLAGRQRFGAFARGAASAVLPGIVAEILARAGG